MLEVKKIEVTELPDSHAELLTKQTLTVNSWERKGYQNNGMQMFQERGQINKNLENIDDIQSF